MTGPGTDKYLFENDYEENEIEENELENEDDGDYADNDWDEPGRDHRDY
jgi:hypothetical protein